MNPKFAEAYYDRGWAWHSLQEYDKALLIDVKQIGGYMERGRAKLMLGQKESACLDFKKALELGYIDTDGMVKQNCN